MENTLEFGKHNALAAPVFYMDRADWDLLQVSRMELLFSREKKKIEKIRRHKGNTGKKDNCVFHI